MNCAIGFAKPLEITNKTEECSICLQEKDIFIKNQQCIHEFCIPCFRRLHGYSGENLQWPEPKVTIYESEDCISPEQEPESLNNSENNSDSDEIIYDIDDVIEKCPLCRLYHPNHWGKDRNIS